ncbi:hypothetical protein DPMN_178963 [Dreissena polymorpha]|uniref:Uncharacterized protein n=1 Tax=Dreissena polymorpha TaxID=45954 RepID=A0A9D4IJ50_DREPO|nr:hypothetical protein DPMN_178963 [Dreissena polymorpha]
MIHNHPSDSDTKAVASPFIGIISKCFEAHLDGHLYRITGQGHLYRITGQGHLYRITGQGHLYRITGQGHLYRITGQLNCPSNAAIKKPVNSSVVLPSRNLADLLTRFLEDFRQYGTPRIESEEGSNVLPSSADLFVCYKKCVVQCSQLSTGQPMITPVTGQDYTRYPSTITPVTGQDYTRYPSTITPVTGQDFIMEVFTIGTDVGGSLDKANTLPQNLTIMAIMSRFISIIYCSNITSASGLIQSILKEGEVSKLTEEEQCRACAILCTAEYCMETTHQLEEKLREKVDGELVAKIDLNAEQDLFHKYGHP